MSGNARFVLVVEDDDMVAEIVSDALQLSGYRVLAVGEGGRALDALAAAPEVPDAIVLDWVLPDMTGGDVIAALALDPRFASIPIVVMSASDRPHKIRHQAAAVVLMKPVRMRTLVEVLDRLCGVPWRPVPFPTGTYPVLGGATPTTRPTVSIRPPKK